MSADFSVFLHSPYGVRQRALQVIRLDMALVTNEVSVLDLDVALDGVETLVRADSQIHVWRGVEGKGPRLIADKIFLVRSWQYNRSMDGAWTMRIRGLCPNSLLERRIVAYYAGSTEASKTAMEADDMIKEVVRENMGSAATDSARTISSSYFEVAADNTLAGQIDYAFSWRNVMAVCQGIVDLAYTANGDRLYFDVFYAGKGKLRLDTYLGGIHRNGVYQPPHLRLDHRAMGPVTIREQYDGAISYAYIGGQGQETARAIGEASSSIVAQGSPFGRIETFKNQSNEPSETILDAMAQAELAALAPFRTASITVQDAPGFRFGLNWFWGEPIYLDMAGVSSEAIVSQVRISMAEGEESITAQTDIRSNLLVPTTGRLQLGGQA